MAVLFWILYLLGFRAFVAAMFNAPVRVNLVAAGLACWILPTLITAWPG